MGGVPILLALAAVTVDYGYQPDGKGGVEYVIQVTPEEFEYAKRAGEISSIVDPSVRGRVSRFIVRVGNDPLPRDAGPADPQDNTVAQAQALDARADQSFVPIPEMRDPITAAPIAAEDTQVSRAKPQENPGLRIPPGSQYTSEQNAGNTNADPSQDPLRRLNAGATGNPAAGPAAPSSATTDPTYSSPAYSGPAYAGSEAANSAPTNAGAANASSGLQSPNTSALGRENNWNREPSASRDIPSTTPRTGSAAAAGNFGVSPPGVYDPRLSAAAATGASASQQYGHPQPGTSANGQGGYTAPSQPVNDHLAAPSAVNVPQYTNGTANQYTNGTAPQYANGTAPQYTNGTANQYTNGSANQYANGNGYGSTGPTQPAATGGYAPRPDSTMDPRSSAGYGNGPGTYVANNSNTSPAVGFGTRGPAGYERGAELDAAIGSFLPNESVKPINRGGALSGGDTFANTQDSGLADEESRGLPQQVFNALLLLSLVANAYLIIQMSKLIQRYRDLRVNLRTATAGKSSHSPAAA